MKKTGLFLLLALFVVVPQTTQAVNGYEINEFKTDLVVTSDGLLQVREELRVVFNEDRHGIYRDLPYRYQTDYGNYYTEISNIQVSRDGEPEALLVEKNLANLRLRIGQEDETINGEHLYIISYVVNGVLRNVGGTDELYWNATGDGWDTTIGSAFATIKLPAGVAMINLACYRGEFGSTETCSYDDSQPEQASFYTSSLAAGEGMTVAVSWPAGAIPINVPNDPRELLKWLAIGTPLFIFALSAIFFWRRWQTYGRDPELPASIVTEFSAPASVDPLVAGVVIDNVADNVEVSAAIIDLARRGYLTIEEIKGGVFGFGHDYKLISTTKSREDLSEPERYLLNSLFLTPTTKDLFGILRGQVETSSGPDEVKLSQIKNTFHVHLKEVKKKAAAEAYQRGFFTRDPHQARQYLTVGIVILFVAVFVSFFTMGIFQDPWFLVLVIGVALAGLIPAMIYGYLAPQLTEGGAETKYKLLGYKQFIATAEKYRAKFYEDNNLLYEVMPYVVMFGLAEKFAKQIEAMDIQATTPVWFISPNPFSFGDFSREMSSFSNNLSSSMASAPRGSGSSGSGFSGGGFGGGGGGSW